MEITLMAETAERFETLLPYYQTTWRYVTEY